MLKGILSRQDMFLIRAMEQPSYMSVADLPEVFKGQVTAVDDGPSGPDISTDL
jgi:hypothetical protein